MGNVCSKCRCYYGFQEKEAHGQEARAIGSAFSIDKNELDEMIRQVQKLSKTKDLKLVDVTETSASTTPPLSQKLNDGIQVVATWSSRFDQTLASPAREIAQTQFIKDISNELARALQYVGSLHWACVGIAFIAFAIRQVDQKDKNHQQCYDLLLRLLQLWDIAVRPLLNHADELVHKYVDQAIEVLVKSILFCEQFLHKRAVTRFLFADSLKNTLDELKERIRDARENILLCLVVDLNQRPRQPSTIQYKSNIFTVGLPQRIKKVLNLLKLEERDTIRAVVLHGMGGVGKSTLADSVYNDEIRLNGSLASCCIRSRQGSIVEDLLNQMIKNLNIRVENCINKKEELWQAISRLDGRVFIYIDNILEMKDLEAVLPEYIERINLPKGSRFMLTTRNLNACHRVLGRNKSIVIEKYQVPCLSPKEGKQLMQACAFGIPSHGEAANEKKISEELIEKIVETCGGLPLAITVLGKQLYGADEIEWEGALKRLHYSKTNLIIDHDVEDQVFKVLQYSYDTLNEDCRKAFLFVTTCLEASREGLPWRYLNNLVESLCSGTQLKTLVGYALMEPELIYHEDDKLYYVTLKMHDFLVSLGHQIAQRENIISKIVRDETSFQQEMDTTSWSNIQWLLVKDFEGAFPASLLDKCERLELLILGCSLVGHPEKVPTHLKVLLLNRTEDKDIPWNLESLENLVYFYTRLGCSTLPVISSTQIRIFQGFQNERFPDKFACNRLRKLECSSILNVSTDFLQKITGLRSLTLKGDFESLPENFGCLQNLQALQIESKNLRELPQSLVELSWLHFFKLDSPKLQQLPEGFGLGLKALSFFSVISKHMTTLPEDLGNLKQLQQLDMRLPMLETLPPTFSQLPNLLNFYLGSCSPLMKLAGLEGQLISLESLTLWESTIPSPDCPMLIPTTQIRSLEKLRLCNFHLVNLPLGIGELKSLKVLYVDRAPLLQTLPNELASLPSLEMLVLCDCPKLTTLQEGPQSIIEEDSEGENVESNNISTLPSTLNSLIVGNCPSLQSYSIKSLPQGLIQIYDVFPQSLVNFLYNTFNYAHLKMLHDR